MPIEIRIPTCFPRPRARLVRNFALIFLAFLVYPWSTFAQAESGEEGRWRPLPPKRINGILGRSLDLWRAKHLWRVVKDPTVFAVFEQGIDSKFWNVIGGAPKDPGVVVVYDGAEFRFTKPGEERTYLDPLGGPMILNRLRYQGEHLGKWLDAATMAWSITRDPAVEAQLHDAARRLVKSQKEDGYIGTYPSERRFYATGDIYAARSWDLWNTRYVLLGLLAYDRYFPNDEVAAACTRLGDLLVNTFGPGKRSIAEVGQWDGLASSTALESIVMLYARTGERRFLDFAEYMVETTERDPRLQILSVLLETRNVTQPGRGKAYELMSNLLGYIELYRYTGKAKYLEAVTAAWEQIRDRHLYDTGGPWTSRHSGHGQECFSAPEFFEPTNVVETCSTATWIQFSVAMLRLTGEARYGAEAERAVFNQLMAAQSPDGVSWVTHPPANATLRNYSPRLSCCASNGPRGLEYFARHLAGVSGGAVSLNTYVPFEASLELDGVKGSLAVEGSYPLEAGASVVLTLSAPARFPLDLRPPIGASNVTATLDGKKISLSKTEAGFLRAERTWKSGDTLRLEFDFPVKVHLHNGRFDGQWIAFTRGPLVLAGDIGGKGEEGFVSAPVSGKLPEGAALVEPVDRLDRIPAVRIKGSSQVLAPYFLAGRDGSGYQSLFPVEGGKKIEQ